MMGFSLYKTTLLRDFYLTMFHAFLHIGEATSNSPASSPIQYTDLVIDTQGAAILLNQFKDSNVPQRVELQRGNDPVVCPVKAMEDFIFLRGGAEGSLFSTPAGRPYTATAAREDLYHQSCPSVAWTTNVTSPTVSGAAQLLMRPSWASRTLRLG